MKSAQRISVGLKSANFFKLGYVWIKCSPGIIEPIAPFVSAFPSSLISSQWFFSPIILSSGSGVGPRPKSARTLLFNSYRWALVPQIIWLACKSVVF